MKMYNYNDCAAPDFMVWYGQHFLCQPELAVTCGSRTHKVQNVLAVLRKSEYNEEYCGELLTPLSSQLSLKCVWRPRIKSIRGKKKKYPCH